MDLPRSNRRRCNAALRLGCLLLACALPVSALGAPPSGLDFGSYLGGAGSDGPFAIGVDGGGNVHVVGSTTSSDFPTVPAASYTPATFGVPFMSTLDPTASTLSSSIVIEAFGSQQSGFGVVAAAVDSDGNVYLTGAAGAGLTTVNAVQPFYGGGIADAFVIKLDASGAVVFSTYLGGGGEDAGTGIVVDDAGRVHVVGYTDSGDDGTTFPVLNASQPSFGGGYWDAFVAQFDAAGALQYTTYLGGEDGELYPSIATNTSGNTWIAGQTNSVVFPTTSDGWRPTASTAPFLRSADGGVSWTPSIAAIREKSVTALAADPSSPTTVYAGTALGGIYRSTDGGGTWTLLHRTSSPGEITSLAVDPATPETIYASAAGNLLRTHDGGGIWAVANVGLPPQALAGALIVDPGHPATVYLVGNGIFRSDDGADHWTPIATPDELEGAAGLLAVDATDSDHLVIASGSRVAQSFDRGQTWQLSEQRFGSCSKFGCSRIGTLALDPSDPRVIYVAGTVGFAKTTDGGQHWNQQYGCLQTALQLLIDPSDPETLYTLGTLAASQLVFARSTDGGVSWSQGGLPPIGFSAGPGAPLTVRLALASGPAPRLYAAFVTAVDEGFVTRLGTDGAVLFSTYAGTANRRFTPTPLDADAAGNVYTPALGLDPTGMPTAFTAGGLVEPAVVSGLEVDAGGRAHVIGQGGEHAFTAELDPADPASAVCSIFAGVGGDIPSAIALDAQGNTYVGLTTTSTDLGVPGAYQVTNAGLSDAYVAKIPAGVGGPITDCPPPATTTTTLPLACGPSDPTDPCDACGLGCTDPLRSASCQLQSLMAGPLCSDDSLRAGLRSFIERKLVRTRTLLDEALAGTGRKRRRALHRAAGRLVAIQKRVRRAHRGLSDGCRLSLAPALGKLRDTIAAID